MAGAPLDLIAVEVRADLDRLESGMSGAVRVVDASTNQITRSVQNSERAIVQSAANSERAMESTGRTSVLLGQQFSQMGQQIAAGTSPLQAFAVQLPDVAYAISATSAEAGGFAAFLGGPWGVALTSAIAIAVSLGGALLDDKSAAEQARFATDALGDAQSILGRVMDLTTGRINTQNAALVALARAQLAVARVNSQTNAAKASGAIADSSTASQFSINGGLGGGFSITRGPAIESQIAKQFRAGVINTDQAIAKLEQLQARGKLTTEQFDKLAKAYANLGVERANTRIYQQAEDLLNGVGGRNLLTPRPAGGGGGGSVRSSGGGGARVPRTRAAVPERQTEDLIEKLQREALLDLAQRLGAQDTDAWKEFQDGIERMMDFEREAKEMADREAHARQETQVRSLAGLYEDAFRGGTKAIWDDFKSLGLRVVAEVLARFTIAKLSGGGGSFDLGGTIGSVLTSVTGFASGGSMVLGGRGGTDNNLLALNGKPIAKVSAGEHLNIVNPALQRGGAAATVIHAPQFNLRGAVVTPELYADMERISNESSARAGQAAYRQSMRDAPTAVNRAKRYGR